MGSLKVFGWLFYSHKERGMLALPYSHKTCSRQAPTKVSIGGRGRNSYKTLRCILLTFGSITIFSALDLSVTLDESVLD